MRKIFSIIALTGTLFFIGCSNAAEPTSVPQLEPTPLPVATKVVTDEPELRSETVAPEASVAESALLDPIYDLDVGWTKIDPGGETRCAHDTEFSFWVRPGTTNKLLVYFQGGGGCWNWETCQPGSGLYDQTVTERDSPAPRGGILDFSKEANPFSEYNVVYVPSCTGDIYLGDNVETYEQEGQEPYDVYHRGYVNLNSALQWAYENVLDPESIFVTGCSAGSIGSIRAAPHLIHNYPNAEVTQLGDSLGFLFNQPDRVDQIYGSHQSFPDWIPAFADFDPEAFRMADFYNVVTNYYPDNRFAQFNTERDRVQLRYHLAGGDPEETFAAALAGAISNIHVFSLNFRSYMADGDVHCIMPGQGFYNREVDGVLFRDWVADLAAGADVKNVQCPDCGVVYEGWEGLPSSHSQVGQWEQIGIMPNARSENRGVEINGKFYIPGGWGGESM
ncbi:MAG: pectin acetylesterase-family hydrolase, partial [Anaerolineae bacterium]